ncbi:hypothetical protein [Gloeobacter kilaueensis]|uniref:hypothetical protein n=1 Tax=Gloeobacter kilaueensis TaxID=1416614 RepID=UPI001183AF7F|nr:hypothetical protein [Gloeobacter kilaueensis]
MPDERSAHRHRDLWQLQHRVQSAPVLGAVASMREGFATPFKLLRRSEGGPQLCYRGWHISARWLIKGYVADLKDPEGKAVGEPLLCFATPELALVHAQKYVDWLIARTTRR